MNNKIVDDGKRLKLLTEALGMNYSAFAKEIGLKSVQTLYDIRNGRHGFSEDVEKLIWYRYPNINHIWWAFFDEPIFRACANNEPDSTSENIYSILEKMQETLLNKDRQIDDLLQIIKQLRPDLDANKEDGI